MSRPQSAVSGIALGQTILCSKLCISQTQIVRWNFPVECIGWGRWELKWKFRLLAVVFTPIPTTPDWKGSEPCICLSLCPCSTKQATYVGRLIRLRVKRSAISRSSSSVSYTHLRAHETVLDLV